MKIEELQFKLAELADGGMDKEADHIQADKLLLKYINDKQVTSNFNRIGKWYA